MKALTVSNVIDLPPLPGLRPSSRRQVLRIAGRSVVIGVAAQALGPFAMAASRQRELNWIAPRGFVETYDDWFHWTARHNGYYGDLDVIYQSGPRDGTAAVTLVAQGQVDASSPSPGVFALGVDRGMDILYAFSKHPVDIFSFAFRKGEAVTSPEGLKGKTIVLGSIGWKPIVDSELAQFGISADAVTCVEAGNSWGQVVAQGKGDCALAWEGLRADWGAQGLNLDYYELFKQSRFPANGEDISRAEFNDKEKRAAYADYLRGYAMGLEFSLHNPRASAVIVNQQFPQLAKTYSPSAATEHIVQLTNVTRGPLTATKGWGYQDPGQFQFFFDTYLKSGQISDRIDANKVVTNELIAYANDFDHAKVKAQAEAFNLPADFAAVDLTAIKTRNPARY
jgi:NitT/TauT family transport system substrate-binding protein